MQYQPLAAPRTSMRELARLLLCVGVFAVALYPLSMALFDRVGRSAPTRLPVGSYLPEAVVFDAPDAKFTAAFPSKPDREVDRFLLPGIETPFTLYTAGNEIELFGAGAAPLPASVHFDVYSGMNGIVDSLDAHLDSSKLTTFDGHPAIEFRFGGDNFEGRGLVVRAPERVYQLFLLDRFELLDLENTASDYKEFKDSFEIKL